MVPLFAEFSDIGGRRGLPVLGRPVGIRGVRGVRKRSGPVPRAEATGRERAKAIAASNAAGSTRLRGVNALVGRSVVSGLGIAPSEKAFCPLAEIFSIVACICERDDEGRAPTGESLKARSGKTALREGTRVDAPATAALKFVFSSGDAFCSQVIVVAINFGSRARPHISCSSSALRGVVTFCAAERISFMAEWGIL